MNDLGAFLGDNVVLHEKRDHKEDFFTFKVFQMSDSMEMSRS